MLEKLKVATVGTGYFSQIHFEAWRRLKSVKLVGICTCENNTGLSFAKNIWARCRI